MSSKKLLILAVAVFGLLAAPPSGAEESVTPQAAEATIASTGQPEAAADVPDPATEAAEAESPQGDPISAEEMAVSGEAEVTAAEEAAADLVADETGAEPAEAEVADAAEVSEAEVADAEGALPEGEDAPVEVADGDAAAEVAPVIRTALGAIGYDAQGRRGWIHVVRVGDTLWDISDAYLGTPWVWPSIWDDNRNIANPHRIEPGDHIWITPSEMRRVTAEEAEALLANRPMEPAAAEDFAVAVQEPELPVEPEVAPAIPVVPEERMTQDVSNRESAGLISQRQLDSAASIVGSDAVRVLMSQEDAVFIGLGEGEVEVGDQFTIFRTHEQVFDPDTGALLGYHVEVLGWLEIESVYPETAQARIRMSTAEVEVGDHLIPREPLPARIAIQESPQDIEGKISFFPHNRVLMGYNDFVYLNRGRNDGIEVGSPLEVYRVGYTAREAARAENVQVPDRVVAQLLVVRAQEEASVAVVTFTTTELAMGDRFRGSTQ
ncbi:MAG TPA: LysM peptidoglycan-binding domain-containing protein [Myxococcota bacterium]